MLRNVLKWIGIVLGGLIALILIAALTLYFLGNGKIKRKVQVADEGFKVSESASVDHGRILVQTNGCTQCHGPDAGGTAFIDNEPPFGYLPAPNLTAGEGGVAATFSDGDFERAIRHGVTPEGRRLIIMPSHLFSGMADSDLSDIVAYLRSVKVDHDWGEMKLMPVASILFGAGVVPEDEIFPYEQIDHNRANIAEPPTEPLALGEYKSRVCTSCHGEKLNGGPLDFDPTVNAANLTPDTNTGLGNWTEEDFDKAMREGISPNGSAIDPDKMPWPTFAQFTDEELHAVWVYLQSLPPTPKGGTGAAP